MVSASSSRYLAIHTPLESVRSGPPCVINTFLSLKHLDAQSKRKPEAEGVIRQFLFSSARA